MRIKAIPSCRFTSIVPLDERNSCTSTGNYSTFVILKLCSNAISSCGHFLCESLFIDLLYHTSGSDNGTQFILVWEQSVDQALQPELVTIHLDTQLDILWFIHHFRHIQRILHEADKAEASAQNFCNKIHKRGRREVESGGVNKKLNLWQL